MANRAISSTITNTCESPSCVSVCKVGEEIQNVSDGSTVNMSAQGIQACLTPSHLLPKITAEQEDLLEKSFAEKRNPADFELTIIAAEVGLGENQVKVGI